MPGAISPATGRVKNANSVWLNGRPLAEDLGGVSRARSASPTTPTASRCRRPRTARPRGRARSSASSSVPAWAAASCSTAASGPGPTRSPASGATTRCPGREAGEWPGPPCYCGKTGCIETFLSGPGLARDHRRGHGRTSADAAGHRDAARRRGDAAARRDARPLRGPDGAGPGRGHQRRGPGRDRPGRRDVERRAASTRACRGGGPATSSPTAWTRGFSRPRTATPAGPAARPGCGASRRPPLSAADATPPPAGRTPRGPRSGRRAARAGGAVPRA